jgi:hypothetical protein
VSEEKEEESGDGGKSEPGAAFLSALEGVNTARKYLIRIDVHNNMMVALSSTENQV